MTSVGPPACAVGRLGAGGPWIGFAPAFDEAYQLVVGGHAGTRSAPASGAELLALAVLYFEESLDPPPDELAATHGDIGALVRHVAEHERDPGRRRLLGEAIDAIDDGLPADVAISRLSRLLPDDGDAATLVRRRVEKLVGP